MVKTSEDTWRVLWSDGMFYIEMPEADDRQIRRGAKKAGLPVGTYMRRKLGLSDEPEAAPKSNENPLRKRESKNRTHCSQNPNHHSKRF